MGWFSKSDAAHPGKHWEVCSTPLKGKLNSQNQLSC
jgi:hypothetical protein